MKKSAHPRARRDPSRGRRGATGAAVGPISRSDRGSRGPARNRSRTRRCALPLADIPIRPPIPPSAFDFVSLSTLHLPTTVCTPHSSTLRRVACRVVSRHLVTCARSVSRRVAVSTPHRSHTRKTSDRMRLMNKNGLRTRRERDRRLYTARKHPRGNRRLTKSERSNPQPSREELTASPETTSRSRPTSMANANETPCTLSCVEVRPDRASVVASPSSVHLLTCTGQGSTLHTAFRRWRRALQSTRQALTHATRHKVYAK